MQKLVSITPGPPDAEEDERGSQRRKPSWPGRVRPGCCGPFTLNYSQTVQVATTSCLKVAFHITMAVPRTLLLKMDLISILSDSDRIEIQVRFQDKCCPAAR